MPWEDDKQAWFRERQRARTADFRADIAIIKLESGCVDCGYKAHPAALDFDHRVPADKKFNVSQMAGRSWKTVLREIAKCDIRCANCHRVRTFKEGHNATRRCEGDDLSPD